MVSNASVKKSIVVNSDNAELEKICVQLVEETRAKEFDDNDTFAIHLALEEAFHNAVKHGNKMNPLKNVSIKWTISNEKFDIKIADDGQGFNPEKLPDPRAKENLLKAGGRGVLLMKSYMDVIEYNKKGNCVHMIKYNTKCKKSDEN